MNIKVVNPKKDISRVIINDPKTYNSLSKKNLTDLLISEVCPIGSEMKKIISDPLYIDEVLSDGAERARTISEPILAETKKIIGLA